MMGINVRVCSIFQSNRVCYFLFLICFCSSNGIHCIGNNIVVSVRLLLTEAIIELGLNGTVLQCLHKRSVLPYKFVLKYLILHIK